MTKHEKSAEQELLDNSNTKNVLEQWMPFHSRQLKPKVEYLIAIKFLSAANINARKLGANLWRVQR